MFQTHIKVRFNHVDAAGLIFYPRYYEMLNQVVEEWFEQNLGFDLKQLREQLSVSTPAVRLDAEFPNPSRLGDVLQFELTVQNIGNSSIELLIIASQDQQQRMCAKMVVICVDLTDEEIVKPIPIPGVLRSGIENDMSS